MRKPFHPSRVGWAKPLLLATIVAGGVAAGYYSSTRNCFSVTGPADGSAPPDAPDEPKTGSLAVQRFALNALDVKDTVEAPDLAADGSGRVFLAWASRTGAAERTVFLARSTDAGRTFEPPLVAGQGGVYRSPGKSGSATGGYERRATPKLALEGNSVNVAWSRGEPTRMQLWLASSASDATTIPPAAPIREDAATPTFIAMAGGPGGRLACAWLGGDDGGRHVPFVAVRQPGASGFGPPLRVPFGTEPTGVCPCCPTAVTFAPDGTLFVGFRNIHQGYRDIAISRLKPGAAAFDGPFPVVADTWKFEGCPHDGPSLAVAGEKLHVLWMDARSGPQRCYHGWANLSDLRFESNALSPEGPGSQGNPRMVVDAVGGLHAAWEESLGPEPAPAATASGHHHAAAPAGGGRVIVCGYLPPGRTTFERVRPLDPKPGAFQTRPALALLSEGLEIAWFELDATGKALVVARHPLIGPSDRGRP